MNSREVRFAQMPSTRSFCRTITSCGGPLHDDGHLVAGLVRLSAAHGAEDDDALAGEVGGDRDRLVGERGDEAFGAGRRRPAAPMSEQQEEDGPPHAAPPRMFSE